MPESLMRRQGLLEVREVNEDLREITAMVSTESKDSYSDILLATGCRLDRYEKNPVVLWGHDLNQPPVANCVSIEAQDGEGLLAVSRFHNLTERSRDTWELYRLGIMRGWSVGFLYLWENDEAPWRYDSTRDAFVVHAWELYEYSTVTVPANADALTRAAGEGLDAAARMLRAAGLPDHPPTPEERLQQDLQRALGGLTGLRNYRRHCEKNGKDFPVETDRLDEAEELLRELRGAPEPDDAPAPPETDPAVGDPSDVDLTAVLNTLAEVREALSPDKQRDAIRAGVADLRRSFIGGQSPWTRTR
ncbi:MAG: hypothetical protein MOGMAGMI_02472 [Candidatus Omnitrophica bacterium]|nr:hypothetical protein [Candidatus Omnitrophota bacterium]